MAQIVKTTAGAVGYVDLADATAAGLHYASIKNKAGNFVAPTVAGATAALAGTTVNADLSYDPINAAGADAYPITSPTWIIAYEKQTDHNKGTALKEFLQYIYDQGEALAPSVGYAPLPASIVSAGHRAALQVPDPGVATTVALPSRPRERRSRRGRPLDRHVVPLDRARRRACRCSRSSP